MVINSSSRKKNHTFLRGDHEGARKRSWRCTRLSKLACNLANTWCIIPLSFLPCRIAKSMCAEPYLAEVEKHLQPSSCSWSHNQPLQVIIMFKHLFPSHYCTTQCYTNAFLLSILSIRFHTTMYSYVRQKLHLRKRMPLRLWDVHVYQMLHLWPNLYQSFHVNSMLWIPMYTNKIL